MTPIFISDYKVLGHPSKCVLISDSASFYKCNLHNQPHLEIFTVGFYLFFQNNTLEKSIWFFLAIIKQSPPSPPSCSPQHPSLKKKQIPHSKSKPCMTLTTELTQKLSCYWRTVGKALVTEPEETVGGGIRKPPRGAAISLLLYVVREHRFGMDLLEG